MFTTVLIDVDNTLLDFHKCSHASLRQGFADFGLPWSDVFLSVFHTVNDGLWRQLESGEIKSRKDLFDIRFDRVFAAAGIRCDGKFARRITAADLERFDHIYYMDASNARYLRRLFGDKADKCRPLLSRDVADPWYTGDFSQTWEDIVEGCTRILEEL